MARRTTIGGGDGLPLKARANMLSPRALGLKRAIKKEAAASVTKASRVYLEIWNF
jgi:hypothetical protein